MQLADRLSEKFPVVKALHNVFTHPMTSLKLQFLLRISPVIPSPVLSYILGTMPVRKREFSIAVIVSSLLQAVPLAYVGGYLHDLKDYDGTGPASVITLAIGFTATVAGAVFISWFTKKKLDEMVQEEKKKAKAGEMGLVVISGVKSSNGLQLTKKESFAASL